MAAQRLVPPEGGSCATTLRGARGSAPAHGHGTVPSGEVVEDGVGMNACGGSYPWQQELVLEKFLNYVFMCHYYYHYYNIIHQ